MVKQKSFEEEFHDEGLGFARINNGKEDLEKIKRS